MSYRIEISGNNRATCSNAECKKAGEKLFKGTLRHGTMVTIKEHQSWMWRHWGCVTPTQIANMKEKTEDNLEYLDGYEELPEDLQEKVRRAMEQGHVDDEDWRGDIEMNRPGQKGFRSPATKKAAKEKEAEGNEGGKGSVSPSKSAPKKRGRGKQAKNEDADEDEQPPSKKVKPAAKKGKKTKEDSNDSEAAKTTKTSSKTKKAKASANIDVTEEDGDIKDASSDEAPPPKKVRGRKPVVKDNEELPDANGTAAEPDALDEPAPKAKRGRKKAEPKQVDTAADPKEKPAAKKSGRGKKA